MENHVPADQIGRVACRGLHPWTIFECVPLIESAKRPFGVRWRGRRVAVLDADIEEAPDVGAGQPDVIRDAILMLGKGPVGVRRFRERRQGAVPDDDCGTGQCARREGGGQ